MGTVYVAEQDRPIRRKVALKVIKLGMDTKEVIARFETERQALAMMDHPGIATVYDAGVTPDGRPYFIMEYIKGEPITVYCDRHRLTIRQRLELFILVCKAVHHAHQKAILHRDVKPSNVLVEIVDGEPVPKVIDFGLAKAMEHRLTERTMFTEQGRLVGTPEYMSPEQAEMTGLNVDTRTDIYSLGVLLYELLTGTLPFDSRELREGGLESIRRIIRDVDPPIPSTQIGRIGEASEIIAGQRGTEPLTLSRQVRGELDWITMRAMEKDRTRRYPSASEFAADIERHLADEPVLAGPPSASYRVKKLVRRHRTVVAAAAVVILALLGGMAAALYGLASARSSAHRAQVEARTSGEVVDFLLELFRVSDPNEPEGNTDVRDFLAKAEENLRRDLKTEPEVRASLLYMLGVVYKNQGHSREAKTVLEEARGIHTEVLDGQSPALSRTLLSLADLAAAAGNTDEAVIASGTAVDVALEQLGPENRLTWFSLFKHAQMLVKNGAHTEALHVYERARASATAAFGPDHGSTVATEFEMMNLLELLVRRDEETYGSNDPRRVPLLLRLSELLENAGRTKRAEQLRKIVRDIQDNQS